MNIEVPNRVNVSEAARRAMDGAASYREGAQVLLDMAERDPTLMSAIIDPWKLRAAEEAVGLAMKTFRRRTWESTQRQIDPNRVAALIQSNREMLMDFPLPGGLALRDATKDDVTAAALFYSTQATNMGHKARWLDLIAKKVPKGKTVADALDNDALATLQEKTK